MKPPTPCLCGAPKMRGQIACPAHWKAMPHEDRWRIAYLPKKAQQPALRETLLRLGLWAPSSPSSVSSASSASQPAR